MSRKKKENKLNGRNLSSDERMHQRLLRRNSARGIERQALVQQINKGCQQLHLVVLHLHGSGRHQPLAEVPGRLRDMHLPNHVLQTHGTANISQK